MTTRHAWLAVALFVSFVFAALASHASTSTGEPLQNFKAPVRIISLIPAVSEMLFALGAGPKVVAVSSFDDYPPEVRNLPRVGALLDPDLERILALRPDLVIVYESQQDLRRQLERASVPMFVYKHAGLSDVTATIRGLGARIGHDREGQKLTSQIEATLSNIRTRVAGRPRPRTLLVFGRDALALRGIYASGGVGFLHDMLTAAGGDNVFADVASQSVQATSELILARAPTAIVELRSGSISGNARARELNVWKALASVPAVRFNRIEIITDPRTVVPGPRVAEGTELLARVLHPEAFTK